MELFSTGEGFDINHLVEGYPWAKFRSGTVVDVSVVLTLIDYGVTNE
jgi:hypothetical protein